MKKLILICSLLVLASTAFAQIEIGIKIMPSIAGNRSIAPKEFGFQSEGAKFRFGFGVIGDFYFTENAAFSTGLSFTGKGGSISYIKNNVRTIEEFSLQYLEIPVTVKLFTNEVAPDMKIYFQTGFSVNPRVNAKVNGEKLDASDTKYTKRFNVLDTDVILGSGLEWQVGESTKLFGGLSYHRGLFNIDDYYKDDLSNKIEIRNGNFTLDLGVKF